MAMKVMADSGGTITMDAADIGAAFATFACNNDFIIKGIGNEMAVSYTSTSLVFNVKSGIAIICGRPVAIKGTEQLSLPANQTSGVYIVARADLTRPVGQEGYITYVTAAQRKSDNLNNANGIHDLTLGLVKTTSAGVSSWTDQRNIMTAAVDVDAINNMINTKMTQVDQKIANMNSKIDNFSGFAGINTQVVNASVELWNNTPYTVQKDSIAVFQYMWSSNTYKLRIDGVIFSDMNQYTDYASGSQYIHGIPLKAGTTIAGHATRAILYGVK